MAKAQKQPTHGTTPASAPAQRGAAAPPRPAPASPARPSATEDQVRLCAYLKWEAAGKPTGGDITFWAEAERELRAAR